MKCTGHDVIYIASLLSVFLNIWIGHTCLSRLADCTCSPFSVYENGNKTYIKHRHNVGGVLPIICSEYAAIAQCSAASTGSFELPLFCNKLFTCVNVA